MSRLLRTLVVSSIVWSMWANAAPALTGVYHVGSAGLIEFSVQSNEIVGRYRGGGECGFNPDDLVVRGSFDGNVFVGQVTLCQAGAGCPAVQSFPVLGFWHVDQMLAQVKFEAGCSSKATDNAQLLFAPASSEDKKLLEAQAPNPTPRKVSRAAVEEAIHEGQNLLNAGDYARARVQFDVVVINDSSNFVGWWGLGMTQVGMKEYTAAVDNLERAFKLAPSGPPVGAQRVILGAAYFKLAEANAMLGKKGAALKALKEAAKLLPSDQYPAFEAEPNLASLRTERDYQQLLASLKKVKKGK